ncbi:MAG: hypothetical protein E7J90_08890 [Cutibacterium avidum]|nr:hypothetical protein [Cutibacterium avidum]MDU7718337.1 hypothetical protein [Cutibacterium avidum]
MQLFVEDIITAYETEHRVVLSSRLKETMWILSPYVDADDLVEAAEKIVDATDAHNRDAAALASYQDIHEPMLTTTAPF